MSYNLNYIIEVKNLNGTLNNIIYNKIVKKYNLDFEDKNNLTLKVLISDFLRKYISDFINYFKVINLTLIELN